jgi:CRP/FNR family transcriptional regulator, nitrogen fixation regulation protein
MGKASMDTQQDQQFARVLTGRRKRKHDLPADLIKAFSASDDKRFLSHAANVLRGGPIRFRRNNVIACEGDAADYIFLVVSGVLRSCKTFQNGTRSVVAFYLPGDLLGWSDQNYSLSVEAATDAMVLFLKRKVLASVAARETRVASLLLDLATNELRRAQEHGLLISRSAKCRVATFLTNLSKKLGKAGSINLPMSHQDIADHLGLTIETLSRTITELERSRLIARVSPRSLMVRNDCSLSHLMD